MHSKWISRWICETTGRYRNATNCVRTVFLLLDLLKEPSDLLSFGGYYYLPKKTKEREKLILDQYNSHLTQMKDLVFEN